MRGWIVTLVIFMLALAMSSSIYKWWSHNANHIAPLNPSLKLIGVVDMTQQKEVNIQRVINGDDLLIVLNYEDFVGSFIPHHPELQAVINQPFDLTNFDVNHQGQIDSLNPIWPYLYAVIYSDHGATYQVRHLEKAGIHAIMTKHLTPQGNYLVILSDGKTRVLYETPHIKQAPSIIPSSSFQ